MFKKLETKDTHVTLDLYKSCRMIVGVVGQGYKNLDDETKKHIDGYKMFIEGYEANTIKSGREFFRV